MLRRYESVVSKYLRFLVFVILPFSLLPWIILQGYSFTWTGFVGKNLWDWMELFVIPTVLGIGAFYLNRSERESDRQRAEERAKVEREIATDRQEEIALQSYIDRMADLLLNKKLRTTKTKEVRDVARTRTLSVLRGLDANRKTLLFHFLMESKLIGIEKPIIELSGANLRGAYMRGANLSRADLSGADLNGADLRYCNLSGASLRVGTAQGANLSRADLSSVNLRYCNLSDADLSGSNLSGANLRYANLSGANLSGTDLSGVDLSNSSLSGANVTKEQLKNAKLLKGATMPDGTKHD